MIENFISFQLDNSLNLIDLNQKETKKEYNKDLKLDPNFISLDNEKQYNIITLDRIPLDVVKPGDTIIDGIIKSSEIDNIPTSKDSPKIDPIEPENYDLDSNEEHIYVKDNDASKYYGDPSLDGSFKKDNLFSELTTEYLREIARRNLGISSENALLWGNLSGNLLNQKDLIKFISENSINEVNDLIDEINLKLSQWGYEINTELKTKASVNSPKFVGTPTTTVPDYEDDSNRIPTTSWVKYLVESNLEDSNLSLFKITPTSKLMGSVIPVIIKWDYLNNVTKLWIEDLELDTSIREYTFNNIEQTTTITLKWLYEGKVEAKTVLFKVVKPYYIGTNSNYTKCTLTTTNRNIVDAKTNEYIYIFIPEELEYSILINGIEGGFKLEGYIYINKHKFKVYRSDNHSLGLTYINFIDNKLYE